MIIQGKRESIGKLDEAGNFVPDSKYLYMKRGEHPSSVPKYEVINGSAQKRIYEYRSGRLLLGEMDEEGNFIPTVGAKITDFKDYIYSSQAPKIYNLPGKFVRKGEEKEQSLPPIKPIHEKQEPLKGVVPRGNFESLVYRPDGKTLALGDSAGQVTLWSNPKAKVEAILAVEGTGNIYGLAFSPDGKTLAAGGFKMLRKPNVRIWDIATTKAVADLKGPDYRANHVAISPDGKWLAAGGTTGFLGDERDEYEVIIWDFATRKQHAVLAGHPGRTGIGGLAFAPDSKTLAVSCGDGSLKLWKVSTGKEIATIAKVGGGRLAFAPDGKTLFGQAENEITVTDVAESKIRARWKFPGTQVKAMALSKDGRLLAVGGYRRDEETGGFRHVSVGKIWDAVTGKELADLGKDFLFLSALAFAPDGKTLAGTQNDMMLHLWKLEREPADSK